MADLCDICIKRLDHWTDPIPNYEGTIICSQCNIEIEDLYDSYEGKKSYKWCLKQVRNIKIAVQKKENRE